MVACVKFADVDLKQNYDGAAIDQAILSFPICGAPR
jgi:hypothetical protein